MREFIERRFGFIADASPTMQDVTRTELLDHEVGAYGFNQDTRDAFEREFGDELAHGEGGLGDGEGKADDDTAEGERGAEGEPDGEDDNGDESDGEDEGRKAEREARAAALLAEEGGAEAKTEAEAEAAAKAPAAAASATRAAAAEHPGASATEAPAAEDGSEDEGLEPLENLRESNRAHLAFRDRNLAPASMQEERKGRSDGGAGAAPAARLHRGHIDPNAVRQRVAAQMNRKGKKGASKAKRNRNKDTGKIDRRAATKMTGDW